jgi:hypothetical protein
MPYGHFDADVQCSAQKDGQSPQVSVDGQQFA